jgi:hypothetical protein
MQSPGFPAVNHTTNERRRFPGNVASIPSVNPEDAFNTPPVPAPSAI